MFEKGIASVQFPDLADDALAKLDDVIEIDDKQNRTYLSWKSNAEKWHNKIYYKTAVKYNNYMRSVVGKDQKQPDRDDHDEYNIFCNEFWVNVKSLLPNIYFFNPKCAITAEADTCEAMGVDPLTQQPKMMQVPIDPRSPMLLENITQDYYRQLHLKQEAKLATSDGLVTGFGVLKFGWQTELKGSEDNDIKLIKDDLVLTRFNPLNFLVDPECTRLDLSDAKYIIFRYIKSTEEIKNTPWYKNVKDLKGSSKLKFSGDEKEQGYMQGMTDKVEVECNTLYELWDQIHHKVVVYVDTKEKPIRYEDWLLDIEDYPCEVIGFNPDPEYFYPIPDFLAYESAVLLKTNLRRTMVDLCKRLKRIYLVDTTKGKGVDKNKFQALLDAPIGGAVGVDNPEGKPLSAFVANISDFVISESYIALQEIADADIERISGINDQTRGLVTKAKRTAQEMMQVQQQQNMRLEEKKDVIGDWLEATTDKMIRILQKNADSQKMVKIQSDTGVDFLSWTKDDIQGKFRVRIDVGSMVKTNPEMKAKQAMERQQVYGSNPLINQVWLIKTNLKDAYQIPPAELEQALNKTQVQMYDNPQLKMLTDALQGNPQLMQAVMKMVQSLPQKPATGQIKPPVRGISTGQAITGQVKPPMQPMQPMVTR